MRRVIIHQDGSVKEYPEYREYVTDGDIDWAKDKEYIIGYCEDDKVEEMTMKLQLRILSYCQSEIEKLKEWCSKVLKKAEM